MIAEIRIVFFLLIILPSFPNLASDDLQAGDHSAGTEIMGLSSPRETMDTFLSAMASIDKGLSEAFPKAQSTLNLGGINILVRAEKARDISWTLFEVLNRSGPVNLKKIPLKPTGNVFVYKRFQTGEVAIKRQPDGRWLFSLATIQALPSILDEIPQAAHSESGASASQRNLPWHIGFRSRLPEQLKQQWLFLENWQWIGIVLIVIVGSIFDKFISYLLKWCVRVWRKRGHMAELWLLSDDWLRPLGLLVMAGVWWLGVNMLALKVAALVVLLVAVKLLAGLSGIWSGYRLVDFASAYLQHKSRKTENKLDDVLIPLIRKTLKVLVTVIGVLFIASNLSLNISGLVAGLGLGGLAFALAAKDMVQNLFGSVTVLLDQSFHVGDWVVIGDVEGTVEEVGLRSTRIRTFYNSEIILPNSTLMTASIDNMGKRKFRRLNCKLSLTYQTPPDKIEAFCEALRELIRLHPYMRKDYFQVYLNDLAASSLDVLVYVFWETPDWSTELRERHRFLIDALRIAEMMGVDFAFPTQTIHWNPEQQASEVTEIAVDRTSRDAAIDSARAVARSVANQAIDLNEKPPPVSFNRTERKNGV